MSSELAFRPTTYASLLRTSPEDLTDEFGDPMDNETVVASGLPMAISQQTVRKWLPAENRLTNITTYAARLRANITVEDEDRVQDERTGFLYMIEGLTHPQDPMGSSVVRLDLRRVGRVDPPL